MDTLAFYIYPIPKGTSVHRKELSCRENVLKLFNACQILEAVISKQGWDFLIDSYGYEQLFSINKDSEWFDCCFLDEFIECVDAEKQISPNTL